MKTLRIGIELRSLNNLIMRYMENHSSKPRVDAITGTNGWIIGFLAKNQDRDIFQRDLEQVFGITRSTASKVINLMEKKDLIRRESVPQDARLKKLVLTPKALKISEIMREDSNQLDRTLVAGFSDEELRHLYSYIDRMKHNVEF